MASPSLKECQKCWGCLMDRRDIRLFQQWLLAWWLLQVPAPFPLVTKDVLGLVRSGDGAVSCAHSSLWSRSAPVS